VPRSFAIARAFPRVLVTTGLVAAALVLAGCSSSSPTASNDPCGNLIKKVLLTDDSATSVTAFAAADVPTIFAIPAAPTPTCYYKTTTTPPATNGISYTVTHRTLLYIGVSDADAAALVAAVRQTTSVAPWSLQYDNPAPAPAPAPAAGATAAPAPESISSSANWNYDFNGATTDDKGSMGFYSAVPVTPGTATHAGLSKVENVVRIETELRQVKK
jgi:hypothetical protein